MSWNLNVQFPGSPLVPNVLIRGCGNETSTASQRLDNVPFWLLVFQLLYDVFPRDVD